MISNCGPTKLLAEGGESLDCFSLVISSLRVFKEEVELKVIEDSHRRDDEAWDRPS